MSKTVKIIIIIVIILIILYFLYKKCFKKKKADGNANGGGTTGTSSDGGKSPVISITNVQPNTLDAKQYLKEQEAARNKAIADANRMANRVRMTNIQKATAIKVATGATTPAVAASNVGEGSSFKPTTKTTPGVFPGQSL